jgi:hypothetical protein
VTSPSRLLAWTASTLAELGIPYHVGGSFASSAHGMYRASADIDFVIDPTSEQLEALVARLGRDCYVSPEAARDALARKTAFNAIHLQSSFKLDFFIKGNSPFDAEELRRSVDRTIGDPGDPAVRLKSAEDTILRKLQWYRDGGSLSDRQWQDVLSILDAMRDKLDNDHLDRWAAFLDLSQLLEKARAAVRADES